MAQWAAGSRRRPAGCARRRRGPGRSPARARPSPGRHSGSGRRTGRRALARRSGRGAPPARRNVGRARCPVFLNRYACHRPRWWAPQASEEPGGRRIARLRSVASISAVTDATIRSPITSRTWKASARPWSNTSAQRIRDVRASTSSAFGPSAKRTGGGGVQALRPEQADGRRQVLPPSRSRPCRASASTEQPARSSRTVSGPASALRRPDSSRRPRSLHKHQRNSPRGSAGPSQSRSQSWPRVTGRGASAR